MSTPPTWLPKLVTLDSYGGDWVEYEKALYQLFTRDFVTQKPSFRGQALRLKSYPFTNNREATYWHLITKGEREEDREPCLRRCERIQWPKAVIENCQDVAVRVWETERKGEPRVMIWLVPYDYVVVLAKRSGYLVMWTAYVVEYGHTRRKLQKDFDTFQRAQNSPHKS